MANTFNLGNGSWAQKTEKVLAFNSENDNYKPLPFDFDRGSTATRVNKQGLIETVGADEPRIDFLNNSKGHLLLEPQRTNYVLYSETEGIIYGSNGWSGDSDSTITQNYGTIPFSGSELKSTRIQFTGSSKEFRNNYSSVTITPTCSIWIKGLAGKTIKFGSNSNEGIFTLNGEWQKLVQTGSSLSTNRLTLNTYSSTTARDIEIYAPQVEDGSYATSYIPTQGSAVTRSAETCSGAGNSTVFNDSEGVLYVETSKLSTSENGGVAISDSSYTYRVVLFFDTSGNVRGQVYSSGEQANIITSGLDYTNNNKLALKYSATSTKLYVNGVQIGSTDTSSTMPIGLSELAFDDGGGGSDFYGRIKDVRVYNTALSDNELQALTS